MQGSVRKKGKTWSYRVEFGVVDGKRNQIDEGILWKSTAEKLHEDLIASYYWDEFATIKKIYWMHIMGGDKLWLVSNQVVNVMRYDMSQTKPNYGLVLAYKVNTDDPDAPLEYSHSIEFPANNSKFMIKKDAKTDTYYTIASRILSPEHIKCRNLLSLMSSRDMKKWDVVCDLIDRRDEDPFYTGFQYVDFEIEGDDIISLIRTAINKLHNYHDANYSTFLRIKNFREL